MYCTAMRQLIVLPCKYYVKGDKTTILESAIENNICWLRIVWALDHVHMSSKSYLLFWYILTQIYNLFSGTFNHE